MKRHIPGLRGEGQKLDDMLDGVFLVRVDRVFYRWHPQRPFYVLRLAISSRENTRTVHSPGVSTALPKRFGNCAGSCGTLATTPI
jgi:hypothetical protein